MIDIIMVVIFLFIVGLVAFATFTGRSRTDTPMGDFGLPEISSGVPMPECKPAKSDRIEELINTLEDELVKYHNLKNERLYQEVVNQRTAKGDDATEQGWN